MAQLRPVPPSDELTAFALWTLEQTFSRMNKLGRAAAPSLWWLRDGEREGGVGSDLETVRATPIPADASHYAIVFSAVHSDNGVETDVLVAQAGDAAFEYSFSVLFDWTEDGHAAQRAGQILIWRSGPTRLARRAPSNAA